MRILQLELTNFRNYDKATFEFTEPRTLIAGPNGSGKSTLIDAIAWALTGRCRGVDGKGSGQKDLIRTGYAGASVRLFLEDKAGFPPYLIERAITKADGVSATLKPDAILARLGVSEAMLQSVLYGATFFRQHHADAKAMLFQLLGVTVPADQLPGVDLGRMKSASLDMLDQEYQKAFNDRAALKKAVAAVPVPELIRRVDLESQDAAVARSALTDALRVVETRATAVGKLRAECDQLDKDLAALTARKADPVALKAKAAAHEDMAAEHQAHLVQAQAELQAAEDTDAKPVAQLQAAITQSETLIAKLKTHQVDRGCVLAASIPCHTDAALFAGQVATLEKDVTALAKQVKAGTERAAKIAAATRAVKDAERNVQYHQTQAADAAQSMQDQDGVAAQADQAVTKQGTVQAALDLANTDLIEARGHAASLQGKLAELVQYRDHVTTHQQAQARRQKLEDDLTKADGLVDLLGPKGIRATVLNAALDEFHAVLNAALQPFGWALQIQVDPWLVLVGPLTGSARRPFELLSAGEQLWTALSFQLALAAMSGLDFCALDAAEAVVGENRRLLTGVVLAAPVGQVLIGMAKGEDDPMPNPADLPGLQVLRLGDTQPVAG